MPLAFYNQVLYELTPLLSSENLKANHKSMLLSNLQSLHLGGKTLGSDGAIDAVDLAAFVASRKAASRGLSEGHVALSAAGNLEASSGEVSGKPAFEPEETCRRVTAIVVKAAPVKSEEVVKAWIKRNVQLLDVQWA